MSLKNLSLRDLEYAVAVAEERHFGRAALRCHVSQPALSAQVKKLEDVVGAQLFERTPRGVLVTDAGKRLIRQARLMLDEGRRFLELASASGTLSGELHIDAIATLGPYIVPHILRPLRKRFPEVAFVLGEGRTAGILASLAAGESDLALISTPIPDEGLSVVLLFEEPFVVIHPADMTLSKRTPVTIDDLDGQHALLLEEGHCLRDQALALCARADAKGHRHATSLETLRHMVAAGAGYSLLPGLAAGDRETFGGLVRYTAIDDPRAFRTIALAFRATDPREAHYRTIADTIRQSMPDTTRPVSDGPDAGTGRAAGSAKNALVVAAHRGRPPSRRHASR
jgi:LysR family hydrogen peroxide-inducible transcriptional activator